MLKKFIILGNHYSRHFKLSGYMGKENIQLGCGDKPLNNFLNIDFYNKRHADELIDLNQPLPYQSETFDLIFSDNVFEHIQNLLQLIKECHRILKKGGHLIVKTPYFKSKHAFVDPTHTNFFTIQSMDYYVKDTYSYKEYRFFEDCFDELNIFLDHDNNLLKKTVEFLALRRPTFFENSLLSNIIVFQNITYILKK